MAQMPQIAQFSQLSITPVRLGRRGRRESRESETNPFGGAMMVLPRSRSLRRGGRQDNKLRAIMPTETSTMMFNPRPNESDPTRREFLKGAAIAAGGLALTGGVEKAFASTLTANAPRQPSAANWAGQMGLELWTVRDLIAKDYVGTLEKVARIGYKEIEPAGGYANMTPKQFRALLDRLGLKMPSTHSGVTVGTDAEMEKQLAGFRVMGIQFASLAEPRPAGRGNAGGGRGASAAASASRGS